MCDVPDVLLFCNRLRQSQQYVLTQGKHMRRCQTTFIVFRSYKSALMNFYLISHASSLENYTSSNARQHETTRDNTSETRDNTSITRVQYDTTIV